MTSRIDVIGQNGNNGIHYSEVGEDYEDKIRRHTMGNAPVQLDLLENVDVTILDLYQQFTPTTAVYPSAGSGSMAAIMYCGLGLCGEAGEAAEKLKKFYRDGKLDKEGLEAELGDVMWYMSQICHELGLSLKNIILKNRDKLTDRQNRDRLHGEGDVR